MPLERWSDRVVVVHLADDPQFTEDLYAFDASVGDDVVLDFAAVRSINSTNLARLLKLRKQALADKAKLLLCGVSTEVWGTFLVTGLDCLFEFSDNVPTALATLQMA
ncbi:MAG: STAS domain-containing protein [Tepidisphaeraceae bacterium]